VAVTSTLAESFFRAFAVLSGPFHKIGSEFGHAYKTLTPKTYFRQTHFF
jgi:hypothetical protein